VEFPEKCGIIETNMLRQRSHEETEPTVRYSFSEEQAEAQLPDSTTAEPNSLETLVWNNPLLAKELRTGRRSAWTDARTQLATRMRNTLIFGALGGGVLLAMLYSKILPSLDPIETQALWRILLGVILGVQGTILGSGATTVGGSIARERTKQTWNALLLTRLTPEQLVVGKIGSGLATGIFGALALMPLLLWCLALSGPTGWLWTPIAWLVMAVTTPLTALLTVRPVLLGRRVPARVSGAAGALWMSGPLVVMILYAIGGVAALLLRDVLPDWAGPASLVLGSILAVPLLLTSPLVALGLALPWFWPDTATSGWGLVARLVAIAAHLIFTSVLLRRTWKRVVEEAPRSAPDLNPTGL
jgi:hypothetical protein